MKLKEFIKAWEEEVPLYLQAGYDNSGLIVGDHEQDVSGFLACLDCTEEIIAEAVRLKLNVVVAHHPVIFSGLKKLSEQHWVERTVRAAIRSGIAIYACHTNLDHLFDGVNKVICDRLGLGHCRVLRPHHDVMMGIKVFVPIDHTDSVKSAMFSAGAGKLGNYEECSFSVLGDGTYRPSEGALPYKGEHGKRERCQENAVSVITTRWKLSGVLEAMRRAHPYEEVAYELVPLENSARDFGAGMVGELEQAMIESQFIQLAGQRMNCAIIKHTALRGKLIKKVAVCGGSGLSLLGDAIASGADIFLTSDIKYHDFFEPDGKIILADIGHYESEQFTIQHLVDRLKKKFPTFAAHSTGCITNPVQYTKVHGNKE